jgi:hypothetical protein
LEINKWVLAYTTQSFKGGWYSSQIRDLSLYGCTWDYRFINLQVYSSPNNREKSTCGAWRSVGWKWVDCYFIHSRWTSCWYKDVWKKRGSRLSRGRTVQSKGTVSFLEIKVHLICSRNSREPQCWEKNEWDGEGVWDQKRSKWSDGVDLHTVNRARKPTQGYEQRCKKMRLITWASLVRNN